MKITALIPDDLIEEVKKQTGGKNITESLIIALQGYLKNQKIYKVLDELDKEPFTFNEDFNAYQIRKIHRDR